MNRYSLALVILFNFAEHVIKSIEAYFLTIQEMIAIRNQKNANFAHFMASNSLHIFKLSLVGCILCMLLVACNSDSKPSDILSQEELVPVLTDLEIAYAGVDQTVKDPKERKDKYEEMNSLVLKKHNMEKETFFSSYQWYESQPEILDTIFKQVIISLNKELLPLQEKEQKQGSAPQKVQ